MVCQEASRLITTSISTIATIITDIINVTRTIAS